MSVNQSDLNEFDESGPRNPENSGKGTPLAKKAGREKCGEERTDGEPCENPVLPGGYERCWRHLETGTDDQDVSYLLSAVKASENDVGTTEETRCPECNRPVPGMYLVSGEFRQCPECGHRRED